MDKPKVLVLVEGARIDISLMKRLFQIYEIDMKYEIVSYNTNIYVLYDEVFVDGHPEDMDILQVLKEHERDAEKKHIFEQEYTDILLVFDLDPQDLLFSRTKITEMMTFFTESTDMGKLYLNYPMVEAFYHMKDIPDSEYSTRTVTLDELRTHSYKKRVHEENRNHDYSKFATSREECSKVINQNIEKGWYILNTAPHGFFPVSGQILDRQLDMLEACKELHVLCTCVYFIAEYNPKLLA